MAAPSLAQLVRARIDLWNQQNPHSAIDPAAALSVSAQEGLGGGIGDGGHAFGPFQLNDAGGVLTGKFPGQSADQTQAWASSPAGIDYALGGIGKAAGGLHGDDAVRAIVNNFERPADKAGEIARALGQPMQAASADPGSVAPAAQRQPTQTPLAAALNQPKRGPDPQAMLAQLLGAITPTGQLNPQKLLAAMGGAR